MDARPVVSDCAKQNGQSPAHPEQLLEDRDGLFVPASRFAECGGMTKREMFAAMAMQGTVTNWQHDWFPVNHAKFAVECADALLAELAKEAD